MKRIMRKWALVILFSCLMLLFALPVAASGFKTVYTNTGWTVKERTAGGTTFSSSYVSNTHILTARVSGKDVTVADSFNGGTVISNGKVVYYCSRESGSLYGEWILYKENVKTGNRKKIGTLSASAYGIDLAGLYKNKIYFIIDVPGGRLARMDVKTGKVKEFSFGKTVSRADQSGRYFVLADGTGAGYSYLGVWDAAKSKLKVVSKNPYQWVQNSKYLYYVHIVSGYFGSGSPLKVCIKRYSFASGKSKTLVKSLKITRIDKMTTKYIKYTNASGKTKKKSW